MSANIALATPLTVAQAAAISYWSSLHQSQAGMPVNLLLGVANAVQLALAPAPAASTTA